MKKLNKTQLARWEAAKALFSSLRSKALLEGASIMYDGTIIEPKQIVITEDEINVVFPDRHSTYNQFQADPDYDHGLHTTSRTYEEKMRKNFKLVKQIEF